MRFEKCAGLHSWALVLASKCAVSSIRQGLVHAGISTVSIVLIVGCIAHFVAIDTATRHNTLVSLLMALVGWVERLDAVHNILTNSCSAVAFCRPVVSVARKVDTFGAVIVSKEHIL